MSTCSDRGHIRSYPARNPLRQDGQKITLTLEIEGVAEQRVRLLPVSVSDEQPAKTELEAASPSPGVTINIEFPGRTLVSLEGAIDADIVRAVVESLRG